MEDFERIEELPQDESPSSAMVWDIASAIFVLGALAVAFVALMIFLNPYSGLNPLPPPTPVPPYQTPTPTITPRVLPPTWTPTVQPTFTPTNTPRPLDFVTNTPYVLVVTSVYTPTQTPLVTNTPLPTGKPFQATLQALDGSIMHQDAECNWMGVGGEAYDLNNEPLIGLTVHLSGTLDGQQVDYYTVTGVAPQYGRAGFEFTLSDHPIESFKTLYIELLDQAGLPLSDQIYFSTYNDCTKTLVLVRFKRVR